MSHEQFWLWLNNNLLQTGMNVQYHQAMAHSVWVWGWAANFAAAAFIIAGMVCIGRQLKKTGWVVGVSGLFGIVILFTPISTWQSNYRNWQCAWSGVEAQLKGMETAFSSLRESEPIPAYLTEQMRTINGRIAQIQGEEPKPSPKLIKKCWGDQLERTYGAGLRTSEQVRENMKREGVTPAIDQPHRPEPPVQG